MLSPHAFGPVVRKYIMSVRACNGEHCLDNVARKQREKVFIVSTYTSKAHLQ
jgi:hypothetical protein